MLIRSSLILIFWTFNITTPSFDEKKPIEIKVDPIASAYELLASQSAEIPSLNVFSLAMQGWQKLSKDVQSNLLTVIDFSLPSTEKRMWVIDPKSGVVLFHSVVSHGRNSGNLMAEKFSNLPESFQSSLGFYQTGETYQGKHGYSLRLDGLEKGFNDAARNRAIVIHGADYAREEFAVQTGRLGRSLGCPALPTEISDQAIDLIKDGTLLFIYGNDTNYLQQSMLLNS